MFTEDQNKLSPEFQRMSLSQLLQTTITVGSAPSLMFWSFAGSIPCLTHSFTSCQLSHPRKSVVILT